MMNLEEKIQNLSPSQHKLYDKLSAMTDEELIEYHRQVFAFGESLDRMYATINSLPDTK